MVIDTSALIAILQDESERRSFNEAIEAADGCVLSVASFVEASMIVESRYGPDGIRALPSRGFDIPIRMVLNLRQWPRSGRRRARRFAKLGCRCSSVESGHAAVRDGAARRRERFEPDSPNRGGGSDDGRKH